MWLARGWLPEFRCRRTTTLEAPPRAAEREYAPRVFPGSQCSERNLRQRSDLRQKSLSVRYSSYSPREWNVRLPLDRRRAPPAQIDCRHSRDFHPAIHSSTGTVVAPARLVPPGRVLANRSLRSKQILAGIRARRNLQPSAAPHPTPSQSLTPRPLSRSSFGCPRQKGHVWSQVASADST